MENAVVANTDRAWFDHFRPIDTLTLVDEVNFWRPLAQQRFRALQIGGPLFFRLKQPYSAVAGFGFFAGEFVLPVTVAWETFGSKNGDPNYERFVRRIEAYRRRLSTPGSAGIGHLSCLVLRDSVFLPAAQWISWKTDEEWSASVVSYKGYDLKTGPGRILAELLRSAHPIEVPDFAPLFEPVLADERTRVDRTIIAREGQGAFRLRVLFEMGPR
jgi:putative restriction endonuclease